MQEQQRNAALAGQFDEMRALLRAFGKQHTIIGKDCHRHAPDMRRTADQPRKQARTAMTQKAILHCNKNRKMVYAAQHAGLSGQLHSVTTFTIVSARFRATATSQSVCKAVKTLEV